MPKLLRRTHDTWDRLPVYLTEGRDFTNKVTEAHQFTTEAAAEKVRGTLMVPGDWKVVEATDAETLPRYAPEKPTVKKPTKKKRK